MSNPDIFHVWAVLRECAENKTDAALCLVDEISRTTPDFNRELVELAEKALSQSWAHVPSFPLLFERLEAVSEGMTGEGIALFESLEAVIAIAANWKRGAPAHELQLRRTRQQFLQDVAFWAPIIDEMRARGQYPLPQREAA